MSEKISIEAEIKSNIGEVNKETKDLTNNFGAFGITIGGVKDKFKDVAKIMKNGLTQIVLQAKLAGVGFKKMFSGQIIGGAKTLFNVIKVGIASTGIGLFIVAFGSLATYLVSTKDGAEKLEKALATMGAAVSVITDRIAGLGRIISNVFSKPLSESLADVKENFKGITEEIVEETKATLIMVDASQKLKDAQRALNVETAQNIAKVEKLKLVAEDINKTYAEREAAAVQAFAIEKELEDKKIALAEETLKLKQQEVAMSESTAEDLDAEAEAAIALANVKQEAAGRQISLQNFLNSLRATQKAEDDAAAQKVLDDEDAAWEKKMADNDKWNEEQQKSRDLNIAADKIAADKIIAIEQAKKDMQGEMLNQGIALLGEAAGEGTAIAKAAAIAQATISGVQGVQNAFTSANANIGATAGSFGAYPVTMAALAAGFAALNISKIASGGSPTGGGGGGGGGGSAAVAQTPAPQMMSGAFDLSGGIKPEPMKAFVLTDEMSNSQNQLANIRRRATI